LIPIDIKLHKKSATLELVYGDSTNLIMSAEFLRVHSPSAEVRGHGKGQETLQTGKRAVQITGIEAVGNYAIKPSFDDGHDSGIYSWSYLHDLGTRQRELWEQYLAKLQAANASRDDLPAHTQVITIRPLNQ